ncbi:MAG: hypothetical protein A2931_03385 [Candidatus Niyogibacteria bacterium RIFCSPLOWO2_01_FULL_45_48]|uniref:Uncharacterized protein n=2 Tax=Candidatus Niyogiibacteriota TaxID=1817912 RepID=A0A1G2F050_9BACT|nr:MAG: hypothetical protein A2835_02980 [Candidatus Niyogibacteria bacterium RIFCSPHIGHO2_01_FULL_45_28]OGZ31022.1 MAG: hypothetical protein A2931_03385 [Candidatus Niyogibacteria bacterium RIFCSPLOWO2_01_FULL_45_48]OGZ31317.1 MAG: hypothetical protein A3J00_02965 [Candidatus Niyogibacteria bacterium RIFCSPLOWO2_02_FULL_45_13]
MGLRFEVVWDQEEKKWFEENRFYISYATKILAIVFAKNFPSVKSWEELDPGCQKDLKSDVRAWLRIERALTASKDLIFGDAGREGGGAQ